MTSSVNFPGAAEDVFSVSSPSPAPRRPPHQAFRRISMPSVPSAAALAQLRAASVQKAEHRVSVASQQSIESQADFQRGTESAGPWVASPVSNASPRPRRSMSRPSSLQPSSLQPPPKASAMTASTAAKKKKVLRELLDTEKTYVEGLEFIDEHFLHPLVQAATEGRPLLSPNQMSAIFSNFVDMLGFHQAFYETLNNQFGQYVRPPQSPSSFASNAPPRTSGLTLHTSFEAPPPVAALLAQHVPFFSMYTPFVTAYPTIMASLQNLTSPNSASYSAAFAVWLKEREQDPACGKLGLRDWLLTLVQRCPRYLLLVKDLLSCTDPLDPECKGLEEVVRMLEKVNTSLNNALQMQSITLQLLAVQKATPNLPILFLEPGRSFIRRGSMFQVAERVERLREFFLFSDCLVWLSKGGEREGAFSNEEAQFKRSMISSASNHSLLSPSRRQSMAGTPPPRRMPSTTLGAKLSGPVEEEKWWFRGKANLLDLDIVVPVPAFGEEGKIEIHSPEMSFSIFCDSAEEREAWVAAIRAAKQSRLVTMNTTNPNSTLTSSTSNQHLRLALQALPYAPEDLSPSPSKKGKKDKSKQVQKRRHVEHFVPAIWVPDSKTDSCMRCGGVFGWRRRRHHCRLCGKCVCANCSGKTFFISSKQGSKESSKPARACNACYEAVFPVLDPDTPEETDSIVGNGHLPHYSSIGTLTALPFSRSTPSLLLPKQSAPVVIPPPLHYELPKPVKRESRGELERPQSGLDFLPIARPRRPGSRPPSELRSSSYTTSTLGSSAALDGANDSSAAMSLMDSPSSPKSAGFITDNGRVPPKTRFSMPAVALHTTPVTARASMEGDSRGVRYSMVLGNKSRVIGATDFSEDKENTAQVDHRKSLNTGLAVGKLNDLLVRK